MTSMCDKHCAQHEPPAKNKNAKPLKDRIRLHMCDKHVWQAWVPSQHEPPAKSKNANALKDRIRPRMCDKHGWQAAFVVVSRAGVCVCKFCLSHLNVVGGFYEWHVILPHFPLCVFQFFTVVSVASPRPDYDFRWRSFVNHPTGYITSLKFLRQFGRLSHLRFCLHFPLCVFRYFHNGFRGVYQDSTMISDGVHVCPRHRIHHSFSQTVWKTVWRACVRACAHILRAARDSYGLWWHSCAGVGRGVRILSMSVGICNRLRWVWQLGWQAGAGALNLA